MQTPINFIKPIRFFHSYTIKEDAHGLKLQKLGLKPKNLELHEYKIRKNKWVINKSPLKTKRTCFSYLKGLNSLNVPLAPNKIFHLVQSQKHVFMNIRKLSFNITTHTRSESLKVLKNLLERMIHLAHIRDESKEIIPKETHFIKVKSLGQVKSLNLPCHVMIKYPDGVRELTIDVKKLERVGMIGKLPQSLRILNVVDKNPLDIEEHVEALNMIKKQINSLKNLETLNLIFPKKDYFSRDLFSALEGKGIEVRIIARIDYEDQVLEEMAKYVERTGSCVKITPSGYSDTEKYMKLLSFLGNPKNEMIKLERLIYPFNSEEKLQKEIFQFYKGILHPPQQIELLFEFDLEGEWLELHNQKNFQEMLEIIKENASADVKIIHHLTYLKHQDQERILKEEIRNVVIGLLLDENLKDFKQEKTIKVTSNVFGFEIIKAFISKLFEESPSYHVERIDWTNSCVYIAGLPEILKNLKNKQNIKNYSLITY